MLDPAGLSLCTSDGDPSSSKTLIPIFFVQTLLHKNHQESCSKIQQCMAIYASFLLSHYGKLVRPHSAWLQLWQQCQFHCTNRKPRLVLCMRGTTSEFFLLFWTHPQLSFNETPRSVDLNHFNSTEFTWQTLLAQPGSLGQRRCQQVYVTHPKQWI